ncbi:ATP-dependent protease ATPase subunit HslU, partial [candidate division KSB1 bacterium]|nr:ATP-dependent protease ATPase subunit HslU [candidate division KSB1 bacterium]
QDKARQLAEERLLDLLLPRLKPGKRTSPKKEDQELELRYQHTREQLRKQLIEGKLDKRTVELEVPADSFPLMQIISPIGVEEMGLNVQDLFGPLLPKKIKKRKMTVPEAKSFLIQQESQKLIDMEQVIADAFMRVENSGIVFLDEIDKISGDNSKSGPDVSREGVQRDLLPVVEGSTVVTKYGMVKTDHILFIASGAFHVSKPSDLIPELQGRFPIRVELNSLTKDDFVRILTEPENALIKQYTALLATENVKIKFRKDAIQEIAAIASEVNERSENIGARRLHTIMTTLLEDILFSVPDNQKYGSDITITKKIVSDTFKDIVDNQELSQFIL